MTEVQKWQSRRETITIMFLLGYISTKNADSKLYKPINMQN